MTPEGENLPERTGDPFLGDKRADREQLKRLPPDEAQAAVERVLYPRLWRIKDRTELPWPGDLADDPPSD